MDAVTFQMTRWQRPKVTYQHGGLPSVGEDLFLQSIEALQNVLDHAFGAGVQHRLVAAVFFCPPSADALRCNGFVQT